MRADIAALLILISFAIGSQSDDLNVNRIVPVPAKQWRKLDAAMNTNADIVKLVMVAQHDADQQQKLKEILDRVSDPASSHYGDYMSYDQVYESILSKTVNNGHILESWAGKSGMKVTRTTKHKEFIFVEASTEKIEQVFQTKLHPYQHTETKQIVQRGDSFQLPLDIHQRVALISGLSYFPIIRQKKVQSIASKSLSNAPIIYRLDSGFSQYLFNIQLVCSNGKPASNSLCRNHFVGFQIIVSKLAKPFNVSVSEANCQVCGNGDALIVYYCNAFGLNQNEVLCRFYLSQETSIPLYEPHTFTIKTKFLSGFSSPATYRSPVEKVIDITPSTLRSLYQVNGSVARPPNNASRQAIAGFQQYLDIQAFQSFASAFGNEFPLVFGKVYGSDYNNTSNDETEASLDTQYMASMGSPIPMDYISSPSNFDGFLIDFFVQLAFLEEDDSNVVPLVYSISYGYNEAYVGDCYISVCETQFLILSLTGRTFFVSSGDDGVSGGDGVCRNPFYPGYPSSSAYVTSVGATQFIKATRGCQRQLNGYCLEEVVAAKSFLTGCRITSGGGFSNFISRPSYQDAAVKRYLNLAGDQLPPETYFNKMNRAYPDISLAGHQYQLKLYGDNDIFLDGTSASSPALAGLISLVVNERLKLQKKPLGLLNPLLYSIAATSPDVFYDITKGNNSCSKSPVCCQYGFVAKPRWDPATGLGSINHQRLMQQLVMA